MSLQVVANFRVIDETEDWVVVDKPAPLIVHPANNKPEPTLLGGLENLYAYEIENGACLGIVTRLDRETSGLVLVAKHTAAARELGMIFERREARKEYLAITKSWPEADQWNCDARILRAGEIGLAEIWVRQMVHAGGRECSTRFLVEKRFIRDGENFSLMRCFPETGRMHQIRVHLAASGFPIAGDKLYCGDGSEYLDWMENGWNAELAQKLILPRHALHATALAIPWQGEDVSWESGLPSDFVNFMEGNPVSFAEGVVNWSRKR